MAQRRSNALKATAVLARRSWKPLPPIAIFGGEAEFFRTALIERFTREVFGDTKPEVTRYQGPVSEQRLGELPLATVLDELRTPSFLSPSRLVTIHRADAFLKAHRDVLERFVESGFSGGHLILCANKADGRTKLAQAVKAAGWLVACDQPYDRPAPWETRKPAWDSDLSHWVVARARERGLGMNPRLAFSLHDRVGTDLQTIDDELEKLSTFLASTGGQKVSEEIIAKLCGDQRQDSLFHLIDCLLEARRVEALDALERLFRLGYQQENGQLVREPQGIALPLIAMLVNRLRSLRRAHAMREHGAGPDDWIRERLVQKPFMDRFRRQLSATPPPRIRCLFDRLLRVDQSLKRGGDAHRLLSILVCEV